MVQKVITNNSLFLKGAPTSLLILRIRLDHSCAARANCGTVFALRSQAASNFVDAGEYIVVVEEQEFNLLSQQGEQLSVWN